MILTKSELKDTIHFEDKMYFSSRSLKMKSWLLREREWNVWKLQKYIRILEYYSHSKKTKLGGAFYAFYSRKVNVLREKLGIEIWHSCFGKGLMIYHASGIVVNSDARIGLNCRLHGNNCIGNDGIHDGSPKIGDNCDIGVGAKIIGNITLGNNVKIAAGAVVTKSFSENNVLLAGVPAQIVKRYLEE